MIRQRNSVHAGNTEKEVDISKNLIKTSARTLPLPLSSTAMAEILTGQQRHHLWFLKVAIALASVGDGSNLPRPYILETKPRMAPELWICAKLEIASSNVHSSRTVDHHPKKRLPRPPARDPGWPKGWRGWHRYSCPPAVKHG